MKRLIENLGGFFDWVWCKYRNEYIWHFLYWPSVEFDDIDSQINGRVTYGYLSGFVSRSRGLHWKRRATGE